MNRCRLRVVRPPPNRRPYIQALLVTIEALTLTIDDFEIKIGWMLVQFGPTWMLLTLWDVIGHDGYDSDGDNEDDDTDTKDQTKDGKPSKKAIKDEPDDPDPLALRVIWAVGPPLLAIYQLAYFFLPKVPRGVAESSYVSCPPPHAPLHVVCRIISRAASFRDLVASRDPRRRTSRGRGLARNAVGAFVWSH